MADFFEADQAIELVKNEDDALRLIEKAFTARRALVYQQNLHPDFFDLSTGLAGAVLQKLAQYQIQTAFVVDASAIKSEYFKQLMAEANTKYEYRFFATREEAAAWLET